MSDIGEYCNANVMPVTTVEISAGGELKGVSHPTQIEKELPARPEERQVNATSMRQSIHVEEGLSKSQKERLSTLILRYQEYFSSKPWK
jgi:hypothetical protein